MLKTPPVHMGLLCALLCTTAWTVSTPVLASPEPHPLANDSNDGLPTMGGSSAFATKADAMASTVENFIQMEEYESAETAAAELTREYPDHVKGWLLLGFCQSRTKKFEASNDSYGQALSLGAEEKTVHLRQAYNHVRLGEYDTARLCYKTILESNYEDTDALGQLAYLEGKLRNYNEASHYYRKILEMDPGNADVIKCLVEVETKRGGGSEVKVLFEKTLELDPDNVDALGKLGLIYMKEKNYTAAVKPLKALTVLEPENIKARRNLGAAYYQLGQKSKACVEFKQVRELDGEMDDLYGPLAECFIDEGATSDALKVIREGIANECQEARLYCLWGKILEKSHNYDGAISKFSKAVSEHEEPWSSYAKKQINRQVKLQKRAEVMRSQQGMQ